MHFCGQPLGAAARMRRGALLFCVLCTLAVRVRWHDKNIRAPPRTYFYKLALVSLYASSGCRASLCGSASARGASDGSTANRLHRWNHLATYAAQLSCTATTASRDS